MRDQVLPFLVIALLSMTPRATAQGVVFQTSVVPEPQEDLASECRYELTVLNPARPVRAVWVIFDRGRDMLRYYGDPDVQAFALRQDWALLLPFHCRAKAYEDMDVDPVRGIGRALLTALSQLAQSSGHRELAGAKLILLGFSGAGSLVARLAGYAPDRILAVIPADAGHFDPLGIDTVTLSPEVLGIPQLILTGSADAVSGTQRPYDYFRRYFDKGAPWAFVIQNKTPHCCIINAKQLILLWLGAIFEARRPLDGGLRPVNKGSGWYGFVATRETDTTDNWGGKTSSVTDARIQRASASPRGMTPAGWLPSRRVANEWQSFVSQQEHPVTSLP